MIRLRVALALLLGAWGSGCVVSRPGVALKEEEAVRLSAGKLWVAACFPFKRFMLKESLLCPFGYSSAGNFYSLHGIWDPAPTLEEGVVAALEKRFGVSAVPLRSLVEPEAFEKVAEETEARFRDESAAGRWVSWIEEQADPLAVEARRRGGEYLLEVWVQLDVFRFVGGAASFILKSWSRVIRLDTGEVVWCKEGMGAADGAEVLDFREYAANDLALFKEAVAKAAANLYERTMSDALGGLFPERPR